MVKTWGSWSGTRCQRWPLSLRHWEFNVHLWRICCWCTVQPSFSSLYACIVYSISLFFQIEEHSNDVHALDFTTMTWSHIRARVSGPLFSPIHHYNLKAYPTDLSLQGKPPSSRDFHSATAVGEWMYIFGGRSHLDPHDFEFEIYCPLIKAFSTITHTWQDIVASGPMPCGRRSHSACKFFSPTVLPDGGHYCQ